MTTDPLINAGLFLIDVIFSLYLIVLLLRFLLQLAQANFYNPVSQFIVKVTEPVLRFPRKIIPKSKHFDFASLIMALVTQFLKFISLALLLSVPLASLNYTALAVVSITAVIELMTYIFTVSIFIEVIASWIAQGNYNPALVLVYQLNNLILAPIRKFIPPNSGFDFSPLIALVLLVLFRILITGSLNNFFTLQFIT